MGITPPGGTADSRGIPAGPMMPAQVARLLRNLETLLEEASGSLINHTEAAKRDLDQALKIIAELQNEKNLPPKVENLLDQIEPGVMDLAVYVGQPGPRSEEVLNQYVQAVQRVIT